MFPCSVPAPVFIITHHIVCLIGWNITTIPGYTEWNDCPSEILIVEINTWLLTLRRHLKQPEFLNTIINTLFYSTWIFIRNIFYPYQLFEILIRYHDYCNKNSGYINLPLFFVILLSFLNYLNTKWTIDLFRPKRKIS